MFLYMLVAYNLIFHAGIFPVNYFIIWKEIQIAVLQVIFNQRAPSHDERLDLALVDFWDALIWTVDLLNPLWVLRKIFILIFHYDPEDILIENKSNRRRYYRNQSTIHLKNHQQGVRVYIYIYVYIYVYVCICICIYVLRVYTCIYICRVISVVPQSLSAVLIVVQTP